MGHGGDDNPEHEVTVSDFWMYRAKVTNSQFAYCVAMGKCAPPNTDKNKGYGDYAKANHPVTGVNYEQAAAYCSFVHGRLPTEAEWEKAARGPDGNIYPWGDAVPTCDLANFGPCEYKTSSVVDHPAGQSYYEALDMAGNVYEWTADWYDAKYYSNSPTEDPLGPNRTSAINAPSVQADSTLRRTRPNRRGDLRSTRFFKSRISASVAWWKTRCFRAILHGVDGIRKGCRARRS